MVRAAFGMPRLRYQRWRKASASRWTRRELKVRHFADWTVRRPGPAGRSNSEAKRETRVLDKTAKRQMKLSQFLTGDGNYHMAGWRLPAPPMTPARTSSAGSRRRRA